VILLVEDDPPTRELYRSALRQLGGFTVVPVSDGVEALRYLEMHTPDAVMLDLGLPRLSGRDVLAEMVARGVAASTPVVIVTADDADDLDPGHYACIIRKPASVDALISAVRKCLAAMS
jgi:CheY-like chemotaxis protein